MISKIAVTLQRRKGKAKNNVARNLLVLFYLARIMHEGNEEQGKYGKQGWSIARRFIAVAMGESDKGKDPQDLYLDERVAHG